MWRSFWRAPIETAPSGGHGGGTAGGRLAHPPLQTDCGSNQASALRSVLHLLLLPRCIKLVKPYREEEGESSSEDEAEAEAGAGAPPLGRQLAERSVDRQLLHALVQAGACTHSTHSCASLPLSRKWSACWPAGLVSMQRADRLPHLTAGRHSCACTKRRRQRGDLQRAQLGPGPEHEAKRAAPPRAGGALGRAAPDGHAGVAAAYAAVWCSAVRCGAGYTKICCMGADATAPPLLAPPSLPDGRPFTCLPASLSLTQPQPKGRMMSSRYTAPEALLRALEASIAPLQPEGGWLATVCDAIEAGLDQGEAFPWPPTAPAASASQAPTPAQAQTAAPGEPQQQQQPQAALAVPTPAGAEFLPPLGAGSQQAALAAAAAAAGGLPGLPSATPSPAAAAAGGGETPLDPRHLPPLPPRAQAAAGGEGAGGTAKYTLTAERRYAQVLDRLSRRGFLLASEMPHFLRVCGWRLHIGWRWPGGQLRLDLGRVGGEAHAPLACVTAPTRGPRALQECARAEGEARPTKPDRKTCDRIVERGQKEGRFQVGLCGRVGGLGKHGA